MSDIAVNNYTPFQVFPKYVTDETLKRARTEDANGNPAVRVTFNDVEPDLTEIEQRIGAKTEAKWDDSVDTNPGSVISILKSIDNKVKPCIRTIGSGPGTVTLSSSTTFDILTMIGGTKPANLKYLILMMRLHGNTSAIWVPAFASNNTHFVLQQEELGKFTNNPSEHILSGVQFTFDANTWVLSVNYGYYTHTYWDDNAGTISITSGSHHDLSQMTFTFYGVEGLFNI